MAEMDLALQNLRGHGEMASEKYKNELKKETEQKTILEKEKQVRC